MAVIEVNTYVVKWMKGGEFVKLVENQYAQFKPPDGTPSFKRLRAYATADSRVVLVVEWDSHADAEKWFAAWFSQPGIGPYLEKLGELVVPGQWGGDEWWDQLADICGSC